MTKGVETMTEGSAVFETAGVSPEKLATLGEGHKLFALHAADGTPIMLTDSREAAIANAWSNELQAVSVH
jgi:hypothetical protein